ncbi:hypothetical protein LguiA_026799 [Lonicera macranthoides]
MAGTAIRARSFPFSTLTFSRYKRLFSTSSFLSHTPPPPLPPPFPLTKTLFQSPTKPFSTTTTTQPPKRNTKVNFSLSDSDSDSDESSHTNAISKTKEIEKPNLPPPYDPFNKKPAIQDPEDPKNLQEVFHKIRTEGLTNNAVKMFDGLSKDGLTHEALELFGQIKDKGEMPEVVAHTAVIEAYAGAGQAKEAHRVYLRMLACGVMPNAYTYGVLIKGLASSGDVKLLGEAKKCVVEMMGKGIRPNAAVCVAVFEGFCRVGTEEVGREVVEEVKRRGFVPEEKDVREVLREKRGPLFRNVMSILFGK